MVLAKVLVVDDAKIMRMTIKNMLSTLGHTVIGEADNGYDATKEFKRLKPDLITLDITMPNVNNLADGLEALKEIIAFDSDAKVIMITSIGEEKKVIEAISLGASNYILKPLLLDKLEQAINKTLNK